MLNFPALLLQKWPLRWLWVVALLSLTLSAPLPRTPLLAAEARQEGQPATLRERLQQRLDAIHSQGNFPGATAGFVLADGTALALATGYSDRSRRIAMKPTDRMLAASIGKTFVSAIMMQLVWEGKVNLDDPLQKWFGEQDWFPRLPNAKHLTIRMLMNHSSGIVAYEVNPQFNRDLSANPDRVWRPEELVGYLLDREPAFEAGKGWVYSDTNYILVGMIIEKATGNPYYQELQSRLLDPLGLKDTLPSNSRIIPGLVQGYIASTRQTTSFFPLIRQGRFMFNPQFEWTGGGLASTSLDISRWFKALYEGRAFDKSLLKQVVDGVKADPDDLGQGSLYGLAVVILPTPLGVSYGHHGIFPGYLTRVMYFPEHRMAVTVQVNTSTREVVGRSMEDFVIELAQEVARQEGKPAKRHERLAKSSRK